MVKVYGYLLNEEERHSIRFNPNAPAVVSIHTDEKYAYNVRAGKIAMLLILSDSVKRIDFEIGEKQLFEELVRIAYEHHKMKIIDMKAFGKKVLLEQAIVAVVSNWESYFSEIFRKILDDDEFISRNLDQRETFENFLNKFKLFPDFQKLVILNKNKFDGLRFGTYIIENRKINFQNLNAIKSLLKLTDIDIVRLSNDWTGITNLFRCRHILVHSSTDSISYTKEEIEKVMKDMAQIIDKIDEKLFSNYDTEYIEINDE